MEDLMKNYLNKINVSIQFQKSWLKAEYLTKVTLKTFFWDLVDDILT